MKTSLLAALALIAFLVGCKKDDDNSDTPAPVAAQPSTEALRSYFTQQRTMATQSFSILGAAGGFIMGQQGTLAWVNPFAFRDNAGNLVAGPVTVEMAEVYSLGDMVRLNMRTVAADNGQHIALQSGGELRLRAMSNGERVAPVDHGVLLYAPGDNYAQGMLPYAGEEDAMGNVLWAETGEQLVDTVVVYNDNTGMVAVADSGFFGWWPSPTQAAWPDYDFFNIDRPLTFTGAGTNVAVHLTNASATSSTMLFLVLPTLDCMIYFESSLANDPATGCLVPVGAQGTLVAVSIAGDVFHAAFVPTTIVQDHLQNITLEPMTQAQYEAALDAL